MKLHQSYIYIDAPNYIAQGYVYTRVTHFIPKIYYLLEILNK